MRLTFYKSNEKYYPVLEMRQDNGNLYSARAEVPVLLSDLSGTQIRGRYDRIEDRGAEGILATAMIEDRYHNLFEVEDCWRKSCGGYLMERVVKCVVLFQKTGIRITTEFRCAGDREGCFKDYQFVMPGAFYHDNDTDCDGREDYLGTYNIDIKDDRNPNLSVTSFGSKSGCYLSLIRADVPTLDTTITRSQIKARHFIHQTDIGSLGFSPSVYRTNEYILRCDYPFYERNSFCLNIDGSEWAAYKKIEKGTCYKLSYLLLMGTASDLTEASWRTTCIQMDRILTEKISLPFSLAEAQKERAVMVNNSFREFTEKAGSPAGYFIHFSPRKTYGKHHLLEYGFTGAQTLLAYDMLMAGAHSEWSADLPDAREHAIKTLDFFADHCIEKSGLPDGIYNVDTEKNVYWWTGILLPFQYARDRETLEAYLGDQIVGALMSVADALSEVKGNYTRSMTDAMYYLLKAYLLEKKKGHEHANWLDAVRAFCDRLIEMQNDNGSWNRGYSMDGIPLKQPPQWFGFSEIEQGSGAIFPIPLLLEMNVVMPTDAYVAAAQKAADFILDYYVKNVYYIGGINDTSHKKSVKMDAASVMFAMRSLLAIYEQTGIEKYKKGMLDAAKILTTWTYLWDVPFDASTLLGSHQFKTTGWAVCDVIPAGSYIDCSFFEVIPELFRVAKLTGEDRLRWFAEIMTSGMQYGLSMASDTYGYAMTGVQCEGYMTSLWLADTGHKEFSGAAAKNKGDDNDTCNGFVNGMALLALEKIHTMP